MMGMKNIGELSFVGGVILAMLAGLIPELIGPGTVATVLLVLGVLVGFLNIAKKETSNFLIAAIALLLAGAAGLGDLPLIGDSIEPILTNIATFVAPAAVIVALKTVSAIGSKK